MAKAGKRSKKPRRRSLRRGHPAIRRRRREAKVARVAVELPAMANLSKVKILSVLPNNEDKRAVEKLVRVEIGRLPVDRFSDFLCKPGESVDREHSVSLRRCLVKIYVKASAIRSHAKATKNQIKHSRSALASFTKAVEQLDKMKPVQYRGLRGVLGLAQYDLKGDDELNEFVSTCWKIKLDMVPALKALERAITLEEHKPTKAGERKKRLRTLVEELSSWWRSVTGKTIAPYVHAKRLGSNSIVIGRHGQFIDLALALLSEVDQFYDSEVISAVTNVHEKH